MKKFVLRFILMISGLLFFQTSYSQQNYLPGDILTLNGDTIQGFIDYRNWGVNPTQIYFKDKMDGKEITYKVLDIKGFSVKDEIYISAVLEKEMTSLQTNKLTFKPDLKIGVDTTFLQTLVKGNKSLYYYKDHNGREYFYIRQGSSFVLLVYKKYLKVNESRSINVVVENKKYLGQITAYFQDKSIQEKINKTKYTKESLLKLFDSYYESSHLKANFSKKIEKMNTDFGVLAGVSISSLDFNSDYIDYLDKTNYPTSVGLSAGFYLDLTLSRNQGKWSICNELFYTSYNFKGDYLGQGYLGSFDENNYEKTFTNLALAYLKINNLIRFKYPMGNVFIFFNVGVSNGLVIGKTNYKRTEFAKYSIVTTTEKEAVEKARMHEQGLLFGAGIKHKKYSIEIRYECSNGMTYIASLGSKVNRIYFLLGYRF